MSALAIPAAVFLIGDVMGGAMKKLIAPNLN
jgi:hypothetical protein